MINSLFFFLCCCRDSHKEHNGDQTAKLKLLVVPLFTSLSFIFQRRPRGYESLFMLSTFINKYPLLLKDDNQ